MNNSANNGENSVNPNIVKNVPLKIRPSLALVMMVKNESKRISVSLDSVRNIVDCFVILDTGSEDNTVDLIREYCNKYNKPLYMITQEFPTPFHFSNARNVVLDFADNKADYLLMLDCNDELRGGDDLRKFVDRYDGGSTAFHVCQEWWNGSALDKYYNIRLIKSKHGWRYKGAIHEYIMCPEAETRLDECTKNGDNENETSKDGEKGNEKKEKNKDPIVSRIFGFSLYQDRTKDDDKSFKRFTRDEDILNQEYQEIIDKYDSDEALYEQERHGRSIGEYPLWRDIKKYIGDSRNLFYYGQTCMCLGKSEKAYKLYKERSEQDGFTEERYHAYYRCGEISKALGHSWEESMSWYIKAYDYSCRVFDSPRAEPLFRLAEHYRDKCWDLCFMYLRRCCELKYPDSAILFVDRRIYDYSRWNLMGIVAYYARQLEIGKVACLKAIIEEDKDIDKSNLLFYVKDKEEGDNLVKSVREQGKNHQANQPLHQQNLQPQLTISQEPKKTTKELVSEKIQSLKSKRNRKK